MRSRFICALILCLGASGLLLGDAFTQINLVSDISGMAGVTDPNLKDPWGMAFSSTSPIWVSDRNTGVATLYNGNGIPQPAGSPLVVSVPPGSPNGPTGQVFAGIPGNFLLNGNPSAFIFDTLGGTIDAWNGGTTATTEATTTGAHYEGLGLANDQLYAANFESGGGINVFNSSFTQITVTGNFADPNIPAGYAPFNVQNIGGKLYVEYAKVTSGVLVPLPGGGGFVDVFDANGNLIQRLISGGTLDAPWGVAIAPAGFGNVGGDLLVGNFGNGEINAFDPTTGAFVETLKDKNGNPIVNSGLWAIEFGNSSANPNALYFTAGLNMGNDGLFGDIQVITPEPVTSGLAGLGLLCLLGYAWHRRRRGAVNAKTNKA